MAELARQIPAAIILDRERGQNAAIIGPGVDRDAIAMLLDFVDDGVAMHDHEAVLLGVAEEGFPDPAQVGPALRLDRHSGPDAGMDEEIFAELVAVLHLPKEGEVRARHLRAQQVERIAPRKTEQFRHIDAIALDTFGAAIFEPLLERAGVAFEDAEQQFFVIAGEENRLGIRGVERAKPLDDAGGFGTSVDQVAEEARAQPHVVGRLVEAIE